VLARRRGIGARLDNDHEIVELQMSDYLFHDLFETCKSSDWYSVLTLFWSQNQSSEEPRIVPCAVLQFSCTRQLVEILHFLSLLYVLRYLLRRGLGGRVKWQKHEIGGSQGKVDFLV